VTTQNVPVPAVPNPHFLEPDERQADQTRSHAMNRSRTCATSCGPGLNAANTPPRPGLAVGPTGRDSAMGDDLAGPRFTTKYRLEILAA
jgi:hypothetical protein